MRLFLALWPDDAVRGRLVSAQRQWAWPARATPVPPEHLHLTLHFLGEVDDAAAGVLAAALPPVTTPIMLRLDRAALWPQGIAVLEPSVVPPALADLQAQLAALMVAHGLRVEARPFRPHVTLARHAQGAAPPVSCEPVEWTARAYALVRSVAGPPLRYQPIARA